MTRARPVDKDTTSPCYIPKYTVPTLKCAYGDDLGLELPYRSKMTRPRPTSCTLPFPQGVVINLFVSKRITTRALCPQNVMKFLASSMNRPDVNIVYLVGGNSRRCTTTPHITTTKQAIDKGI